MDPSLLLLLSTSMEKVINSALRYDPASQKSISQIEHILAIESTIPQLTLYIHGKQDGIYISSHCESPVTTHLRGTPLALLSLVKQPTNLANSGVELSGRVGLLEQWQQVLQQLDIDWEDAISQVLGDIAGPTIAQGIRTSLGWARDQQQTQQRLLKDYIEEELQLTPTQAELTQFSDGVNQVSQDLDRIDARIAQLKQKLQQENTV